MFSYTRYERSYIWLYTDCAVFGLGIIRWRSEADLHEEFELIAENAETEQAVFFAPASVFEKLPRTHHEV